jgi:glycosyltransferase involved in cell wall biosynthesis
MEKVAKTGATVTVGISSSTERVLGELDFIIPCGVDLSVFRPGPKSFYPAVLFVGTLGGRKRGRLLLDSFTRVIRKEMPQAELWMVVSDGVNERIEGVRWYRGLDTVSLSDLYRQAWVFCLPSSYEGFGVPYIEAMASGTAVVATHNSGANELFQASDAGVTVEDIALGKSIVRLLTDEEARLRMERAGRQDSAKFSWDVIAAAYESAYGEAVARQRSGQKAK